MAELTSETKAIIVQEYERTTKPVIFTAFEKSFKENHPGLNVSTSKLRATLVSAGMPPPKPRGTSSGARGAKRRVVLLTIEAVGGHAKKLTEEEVKRVYAALSAAKGEEVKRDGNRIVFSTDPHEDVAIIRELRSAAAKMSPERLTKLAAALDWSVAELKAELKS
jgi:hypothetical protein